MTMVPMSLDMRECGERLRALRLQKGMEPDVLAAAAKTLGFSLGVSTIYDIERGAQGPRPSTLEAYAAGLGVSFHTAVITYYGLPPGLREFTPEALELLQIRGGLKSPQLRQELLDMARRLKAQDEFGQA